MNSLLEAIDRAPADRFYVVIGLLLIAFAVTERIAMRRLP